ncbi:hypothetical protein Tco_0728644 [Tanacetum coccineum]|uniref:Uncharacterized protein n=1 Tax=Tanacetum coccineum TaxID=301880 RepID=A0ABQ4YLP2_9ASTR
MKDKMVYKGDNVVGALMNVPIFVGKFSDMTDFVVLEDIYAYRDERMGDIIVGEPFLREVGIKTKHLEGIITLYNGDDEVSEKDVKNGISHAYQKLKGFYKGVLNLGPVLYKVEDIATYLVEYVKFWDDWEVDRYGNANLDVLEIYMHQFWFTINKQDSSYRFKFGKKRFTLNMEVFREIFQCLSGKMTGLDKMRLSRAQILWGMYYKKNVDFVELLWEDFIFQIDNRDTKKQEKMYYPRFTKAVIHHFITKDKTISIRNRLFMHTTQDDCVLSTMRFVSKSEDFQVYRALLPKVMTNQKMRNSYVYNTYLAYATRAATPKKARKFKKHASPSKKRTLVTVEDEEPEPAKKVKRTLTTTGKSKGIDLLSDVAALEAAYKAIDLLSDVVALKAAQLKKAIKISKHDTSIHQAGGSGDGTGSKPGVPDEPKGKSVNTHEGTSLKPGVPDVSKTDSSKSEYKSWGDSGDEANVQETNDDEEESDDEFIHTLPNYVPTDDETNDESNDVDEEEYDRIDKELYGDVNVRLTDAEQDDEDEKDADMTDVAHYVVQATKTATPAIHNATTEVPPFSSSHSVSSNYTSAFLNLENHQSTEREVVSMLDINVQHEVPHTSPLPIIHVSLILEHTVFNPFETVITAPAITINSFLSSLFPTLLQSIPIPTPTQKLQPQILLF